MPVVFKRAESSRERPISLPADAIRKRLRLAVVVVVLTVAAGLGYDIKSTPPMYLESAAVIFSLPPSQNAPNAYVSFTRSLITSGDAMAKILTSPQTQRQIRAAGGAPDVNMALINLYNEDYPDYGEPLATLTAKSHSAAAAHHTFMVSARLLGRLLSARQAQAGVLPRDRITAQIVADTGPVAQAGSPKRAFAGLALLALVVAVMMCSMVDRLLRWNPVLSL
jgi:hypothetical protein